MGGKRTNPHHLEVVDRLAHKPAEVETRPRVRVCRRGRTESQKQDVGDGKVHYVVVGNRPLTCLDDDVYDYCVTSDANYNQKAYYRYKKGDVRGMVTHLNSRYSNQRCLVFLLNSSSYS